MQEKQYLLGSIVTYWKCVPCVCNWSVFVCAVMDHHECGWQKYVWIFPNSALFHCLNKFSVIRGTIDIVLGIIQMYINR